MDKIQWSDREWFTRERWGRIHPGKSYCWYDPECVFVDNKGYLHLTTDLSPTEIKHSNGETYKPNLGTGLICSVEDFSYGRFEIDAMMPSGSNKWPAFWLWGSETWPPEIDILEGYTDNRRGYLKFNRFNPMDFGTYRLIFGLIVPKRRIITLGLRPLSSALRIQLNTF
jgi:beta-glucanase (GH16 family)